MLTEKIALMPSWKHIDYKQKYYNKPDFVRYNIRIHKDKGICKRIYIHYNKEVER